MIDGKPCYREHSPFHGNNCVLITWSTITKEEWSIDTSAEAVKARTKAAEAAMASLHLGDDDSDEDADSPYGQLGKWAEENRDASAVDVYKKADDLGIAKKHKAVQVLVQTLFDEDILTQISANAPLFKKVRLLGRRSHSDLSLTTCLYRW